jgi:hypothetical protein
MMGSLLSWFLGMVIYLIPGSIFSTLLRSWWFYWSTLFLEETPPIHLTSGSNYAAFHPTLRSVLPPQFVAELIGSIFGRTYLVRSF